MMKSLKVKTPAKINLTLEIIGKRPDGYHEIQSIMQAVSLYDYITITIEDKEEKANNIEISGNNPLIPYDKTNLAYISAEKLLNKAGITNKSISIFIEKNIPVAAGLAGGSSNAAGVLFCLNELLNSPLRIQDLSDLASEIGADVNFCLHGGTQLATSKGERLEKIKTVPFNALVCKPKKLFISAKEAYDKYSNLPVKPSSFNSKLMVDAINHNDLEKITLLLNNGLEEAILPDYPEILDIKHSLIEKGCLNALMSGSGPSVFGIYVRPIEFSKFITDADIFEVKAVENGVTIVN